MPFFFILLVAIYLRFQSFDFGMPYMLVPEESYYLLKILYLTHHFLNPDTVAVPNFFLYLNSVFLFLFTHTFDANLVFNALDVSSWNIYFPLRLLSVLFSIGSVIIVYLIGSIFSSACGLFAGGFFAVSCISILYSKLFLPFSSMVFFSLLSVLFAMLAVNTGKIRYLTLGAFSSVLSASMYYIGAVSIVPVFFSYFLNKEFREKKPARFYLLLFLISFLILNPFFIFYIFSFLKNIFGSYVSNYHLHHQSSCFLYLINFPLLSLGPVLWTCALFLPKYKKNCDETLLKILFSLPLFYFALVGFLHLTKSAYACLLIPYFCLAGGLVISFLFEERKKDFVFLAVLVLAFYIPFKYAYKLNKLLVLSDTRVLASEWIKSNTSDVFKIAWDKNSLQLNWHDPYDKKELKNLADDKDEIKSRRKFPLTEKFLLRKDWFKILKKKADYVVINSIDSEAVLRSKSDSGEKKFYKKMLKLRPAVVFDPYLMEYGKKVRLFLDEDLYLPVESLWFRERTGPVIKIYKL